MTQSSLEKATNHGAAPAASATHAPSSAGASVQLKAALRGRDLATQLKVYWESCGQTGRPYADELLGGMSEHDHAWALALAVARVEDRDPRSLDTIARQRLTWCIPDMQEVAARDAHAAPHSATR